MSCDDSNNAVYVSSSDNLQPQDDNFDPPEGLQRQDNDNFFQPHTNSSLPSAEQFDVPPAPQLTLYFSQMSIDDQQQQCRKQMSIELMSPMKVSPPKHPVLSSMKIEQPEPVEQTEKSSLLKVQQIAPDTEEVSIIRPRRKVSKTNYNVDDSPDEDDSGKPCHCSKTHCLQLYCACFHNRRQCGPECKCNDCYNDGQHEDEILKAVEQIKMKEQRASHHDLDSFDTKQVWGCKCKKTKCIKGYCECFIRGKKCTSHCQCSECANKRQVLKKPKIKNTEVKKKIKKKST